MPIIISSVATILATDWTNRWTNDVAIATAELLIENCAFYPLFWWMQRLLPAKETKKDGHEPLKEMLAVEALDLTLRFMLFLIALGWPNMKAWLSGVGSLALDLAFLFFLSRSHQLLEIFRQMRPEFITLDLSTPDVVQ